MMRDELSSIATDVNTFGLCPPLFHPSSFALHKPVTIKNMMLVRLCKSTPCALRDQYPQRLPLCKVKQLLSIVLSLAMDPREIIFGHKSPVGVREKH